MGGRPGLGSLGVPFQRGHLGNIHVFGQLGDAPFSGGVGLGLFQHARVPFRNAVLMDAAVRFLGLRQRNGPGFRRGFEISGPDPPFPSM